MIITTELINKALDYQSYKDLIERLLKEGQSTGPNQSQELLQYSELNVHRMNRVEKTTVLIEDLSATIDLIEQPQIWLILAEGWCGDAAQTIPIFHLIEKQFPKIKIKLLLRDENVEVMDHFLTDGSRSIPKVLMLDASSLNLLAQWGPRPSEAIALINNLKAAKVDMMEIKEKLHAWYAKNKGVAVQSEIIDIIAGLHK
jgi:hypothetical protein